MRVGAFLWPAARDPCGRYLRYLGLSRNLKCKMFVKNKLSPIPKQSHSRLRLRGRNFTAVDVWNGADPYALGPIRTASPLTRCSNLAKLPVSGRWSWELSASPIFPARLVSRLDVFPSPVDNSIPQQSLFVNRFLKKKFFIFLAKNT